MRRFARPSGPQGARQIPPHELERLLFGKPTTDALREARLAEEREQRRLAEKVRHNNNYADQLRHIKERQDAEAAAHYGVNKQQGKAMTVSLYRSTASGANEIVVQTNAQSLEVFIAGLSDALAAAVSPIGDRPPTAEDQIKATIAATLKNAFPIAFAIAGYKADKVSESKLLTCGFASPDASELVASSTI